MEESLDFSFIPNQSVSRSRNPLDQARASFASIITLLNSDIRSDRISSYFDEASFKFGNHFNKTNPKTLAAAYALVHEGLVPSDKGFPDRLERYATTLMQHNHDLGEEKKKKPIEDAESKMKEKKENYKADIYRYYRVISE